MSQSDDRRQRPRPATPEGAFWIRVISWSFVALLQMGIVVTTLSSENAADWALPVSVLILGITLTIIAWQLHVRHRDR